MNLMEGRWMRLKWAIDGLQKSGVPLVGYDGTKFLAAEKGDDPALYYFVPKIMAWFGLSAPSAVHLFFGSLLAGSFALGLVGLFLLIRSWRVRLIFLPLYGLLMFVTYLSQDVYMASSCAVVSTIPLFVYFYKTKASSNLLIVALGLIGFWAAFSNTIRMHAGTPILLFVGIYLWLEKSVPSMRRGILFAVFILGWLIPQLYTPRVLHQRNQFLSQNQPDLMEASGKHVFWHSICIGLSFLSNDYGIPTDDQAVKKKVSSLAPNVLFFSKEYDAVVKNEVLKIVRGHPYFVLRTFFAKAGVMAMYVLFFGNIGLIWAFRNLDSLALRMGFLFSAAFSTLTGFAVTPYHFYCLGLMALITLVGILGIAKRFDSDFKCL